MNNWYEALEVCSDFIEAWLCYHFIGIFLPDRGQGAAALLSAVHDPGLLRQSHECIWD